VKKKIEKKWKNPPIEGLVGETLKVVHSHKGKGNKYNTFHGSYLIGWKFEIYMLPTLYHTIGAFWGYLDSWSETYATNGEPTEWAASRERAEWADPSTRSGLGSLVGSLGQWASQHSCSLGLWVSNHWLSPAHTARLAEPARLIANPDGDTNLI